MGYTTPTELRAEGVKGVPGRRLLALINEATAEIDRLTGWFFEPRRRRYVLDGRGVPSLILPAPPIELEGVWIKDFRVHTGALIVVGAPVETGFDEPRITRRYGAFYKGRGNVVVEGLFGFTEPDGSRHGRAPMGIRRACILLVLKRLDPIANEAAFEVRNRWRILEERTRDQSYKLDRLNAGVAPLTGDPEIDALLQHYRRPRPLGAA